MPLLGIFSKKNKAARKGDVTRGSPSINSLNSEFESALSSPTSEYIHTDRSLPSSPSGRDLLHPRDAARPSVMNVYPSAGASSSKLRLPFGRKKMAASSSTVSNLTDYAGDGARPGYLGGLNSGAMSDAEADPHRLVPPPTKRSVFATYGDPQSALSTRSLPSDRRYPHSDSPTPSNTQKRPFFNWSKSQNSTPTKSALQTAKPAASSPLSPPIDAESSFNLKSFRHVRPPSPARSTASAASLQPPAVPVPPFEKLRPAEALQDPLFLPLGQSVQGHSMIKNRVKIDSDESASSSEVDSDDGRATKSNLGRRRTLTQHMKARGGKARATQSEIGHGSSSSSHVHSRPPRQPPPRMPASVSNPDVRKRASLSTSGASPSAPAQRASLIANSNPGADSSRQSRHIREASSVSNPPATVRRSIVVSQDSDTSDSEDDAPLASLVPPRRPGSSMSQQSNRSQSSARAIKPLIDINTLTGPNRRPLESGPNTSAPSPAFTPGKTLVSSPVSMTPPTLPITSTSPPAPFVSPPGSPVKAARTLSVDPSPVVPQRTIPVRKETAESAVREGLNERLGKVMMSSASSAASLSSATSSSVPSGRRSTASSDRVQMTPARPVQTPTLWTDPPTDPHSTIRQIGHRRTSSDNPSVRTRSTDDNMDELARMLGGGIRLISKNGEEEGEEEEELTKKVFPGKKKSFPGMRAEDEETTEDEMDEEDSDDQTEGRGKAAPPPESISPPIPILRRTPVPSFSVTSRPQQQKGAASISGVDVSQPRQRSSTVIPASPTTASSDIPANSTPVKATPPPLPLARAPPPKNTKIASASVPNVPKSAVPNSAGNNSRPRSSSMMPLMSIPASPKVAMFPVPTKPFATLRESPASSTGDSSSGRAPLTPRDGSDIASTTSGRESKGEQWSGGASGLGLGPKGHAKRRSVSFEDDAAVPGKGKNKPEDDETRRRDRRRDEAKAAIELGNVINGPGPIVDDEEDTPIGQINSARMSTLGPVMGRPMSMQMGFGGPAPGWNGWPQMAMGMGNPGMLSPAQFMGPTPPPGDPAFFAAHQQAMMYAKQTYQMAVAQQAMAAAGDEWERTSAIGFNSGGSMYGGGRGVPSMYGMGGGWSSAGSMIFPSAQSMYGGGARSEYGGGSGGGRGTAWNSSQSVYGESFGNRRRTGGGGGGGGRGTGGRDSAYVPPVPPVPSQAQRPSMVGGQGVTNPRTRTVSQPANPVRPSSGSNSPRRPPPSSWKAGT
ncbi:uncharacterized protein BT62DRAFT_915593 [Guyanagaster necrorhizus]|uniref:Uncharacterized protein n=1 Tax=Guyanagaster necrorhizus TaxID=856835 RepID=A0A9P7W3Z2_9AGAR|nr:uncharacterized protein BT62DRAFT_915593 [Guyanagaster necrorhizus MCA 3950]KAG7451748.1 hypothetical protein BT62DRAFT_915593 [Guyanagaster necrorhizus MCA 3950]